MKSLGLTEGVDFVELVRQIPGGSQRGSEAAGQAPKRGRGRPAINYLLHPDALQLCLMRARNTRKYAEHYMALNRGLIAYDAYCKLFKDRYIETLTARHEIMQKNHTAVVKQKDDKIDSLETLIREMRQEMASGHRELKADIREVKAQNEELKEGVTVLRAGVAELSEEVRGTADRLDEVADIVAPRPAAPGAAEHLLVAYIPNVGGVFAYQVIRRQTQGVAEQLKKIRRSCPSARIVVNLPGVPNVRTLWLRIRERHGARIAMSPTNRSWFRLVAITEAEFAASALELSTGPQRELGVGGAAARGRQHPRGGALNPPVVGKHTHAH